MNTYNKHLLSIDMQIEAYKEAKMIIDSPKEVRWALENIGYYRLRGYSFQFYNNKTKTYEDGTHFSNIIKLYKFDVELSHLLFAMISKIEVSVRARLIDAMLVYKDALIWINPIIYSKEKIFYKNLSVISSEINRSSDVFIKHHLEKYDGNIPIWAVVEIMSFGTLSKVIKNLKSGENSAYNRLAEHYKYTSPKGNVTKPSLNMFSSWLKSVSTLRNICAHNSRIYNRTINSIPQLLKADVPSESTMNNGLYKILLAMKYLSPTDCDWSEFKDGLVDLLEKYKTVIDLSRLNFPSDWENHL